MDRKITKIFYWLFWTLLLTPLIYSRGFEYPFVIPKALFLQTVVELALPFYLYFILRSSKYRPNFKNPLTFAVLIYLAFNVVAALFGVNFSQSFWGIPVRMSGIFNLLHLVLIYFYVLLLKELDLDFVDRLVKTLIWIAAIVAGYGIWIRIGLPRLFNEVLFPRISSFSGNPIFLASFLILPFFLTIFVAYNEQRRNKKWIYWILASIELIGVYLSKTRGAYVGLIGGVVAGIIVYLFFLPNRKIKNYGLAALLGLVLVSGFLLRTKVHFTDNDSVARLIQWKSALKGVGDHPILGVGPENYSVVADKYFNPEIYKYDSSWWDKPHNNLLEGLLTTGILGLATYLAVIATALWILWISLRKQILSLAEFSIFVAALVSFLVQNLFVFDTVSANLAFYIFIGLIGCFVPQAEGQKEKSDYANWSKPALYIMSLAVLGLIYFGNWLPARTAQSVNQGIASDDPQIAKAAFDRAADLSTNTPQLADVGNFYEEGVVKAANREGTDPKFLSEYIDSGIGIWEKLTTREQHIPYYWLKLGNLYYLKVYFTHGDAQAEQKAQDAVSKASNLVPNRVEPMILAAKIKLVQNQIAEGEAIMDKLLSLIPQDPNSQWHYRNKKDALVVFDLLSRYYASKNDYPHVISIYQKEIKLDPNNFQLYSSLAAAYASAGNKAEAIKAAQKVLELNPAAQADVDAFIKNLK